VNYGAFLAYVTVIVQSDRIPPELQHTSVSKTDCITAAHCG